VQKSLVLLKNDNQILPISKETPLIVTPYLEEWDALGAAWLPGSEGAGVADVLFGETSFTGKLS
jgi:hypothetical protein